jgi:hypothetical protein
MRTGDSRHCGPNRAVVIAGQIMTLPSASVNVRSLQEAAKPLSTLCIDQAYHRSRVQIGTTWYSELASKSDFSGLKLCHFRASDDFQTKRFAQSIEATDLAMHR